MKLALEEMEEEALLDGVIDKEEQSQLDELMLKLTDLAIVESLSIERSQELHSKLDQIELYLDKMLAKV